MQYHYSEGTSNCLKSIVKSKRINIKISCWAKIALRIYDLYITAGFPAVTFNHNPKKVNLTSQISSYEVIKNTSKLLKIKNKFWSTGLEETAILPF